MVDCLRLFIPSQMRGERVKPVFVKSYVLCENFNENAKKLNKNAKKQQEIIDFLLKNKIMLIDSASYAAQNELLLVIAKSDFTNRVQNFYNKTEEYLNREWFLALGDKKYYDFVESLER